MGASLPGPREAGPGVRAAPANRYGFRPPAGGAHRWLFRGVERGPRPSFLNAETRVETVRRGAGTPQRGPCTGSQGCAGDLCRPGGPRFPAGASGCGQSDRSHGVGRRRRPIEALTRHLRAGAGDRRAERRGCACRGRHRLGHRGSIEVGPGVRCGGVRRYRQARATRGRRLRSVRRRTGPAEPARLQPAGCAGQPGVPQRFAPDASG